jgi:hypothetical protein
MIKYLIYQCVTSRARLALAVNEALQGRGEGKRTRRGEGRGREGRASFTG